MMTESQLQTIPSSNSWKILLQLTAVVKASHAQLLIIYCFQDGEPEKDNSGGGDFEDSSKMNHQEVSNLILPTITF